MVVSPWLRVGVILGVASYLSRKQRRPCVKQSAVPSARVELLAVAAGLRGAAAAAVAATSRDLACITPDDQSLQLYRSLNDGSAAPAAWAEGEHTAERKQHTHSASHRSPCTAQSVPLGLEDVQPWLQRQTPPVPY